MTISEAIQYCKDSNYDQNPVLILRAMQRKLMKGCPLEIINPTVCIDGIINIIMVNRDSQLSFDWSRINFGSRKEIYYFRRTVLWWGRFDWPKNVALYQILIWNLNVEITHADFTSQVDFVKDSFIQISSNSQSISKQYSSLVIWLSLFLQTFKKKNDEN